MSVGLLLAASQSQADFVVQMAVDSDPAVLEIFTHNLPVSRCITADVASLFDGAIGSPRTKSELAVAELTNGTDILVGGPPCQGHSDLNNHTRRSDPKNALYLSMARAAEVIAPRVVVIENVPTIRCDTQDVSTETINALKKCGYKVASDVLNLHTIGVPQRRSRFVVVASRVKTIDPKDILQQLMEESTHTLRTVRWAIEDLLDCESESLIDIPSAKTKTNAKRMAYLFEHGVYDLPDSQRPKCHKKGNHSYKSVYGRLRWSEPAQTITTGFGCMGQGRYVHPQRRRTLTPHEAARLQTIPDWFDFGETASRGVISKAIGNAVPPLLTYRLGMQIIPKLLRER